MAPQWFIKDDLLHHAVIVSADLILEESKA